jgi:hypothetical protein
VFSPPQFGHDLWAGAVAGAAAGIGAVGAGTAGAGAAGAAADWAIGAPHVSQKSSVAD